MSVLSPLVFTSQLVSIMPYKRLDKMSVVNEPLHTSSCIPRTSRCALFLYCQHAVYLWKNSVRAVGKWIVFDIHTAWRLHEEALGVAHRLDIFDCPINCLNALRSVDANASFISNWWMVWKNVIVYPEVPCKYLDFCNSLTLLQKTCCMHFQLKCNKIWSIHI